MFVYFVYVIYGLFWRTRDVTFIRIFELFESIESFESSRTPFEAFVRRHHYDDIIRCAVQQQRPRRVGAPGGADPR